MLTTCFSICWCKVYNIVLTRFFLYARVFNDTILECDFHSAAPGGQSEGKLVIIGWTAKLELGGRNILEDINVSSAAPAPIFAQRIGFLVETTVSGELGWTVYSLFSDLVVEFKGKSKLFSNTYIKSLNVSVQW